MDYCIFPMGILHFFFTEKESNHGRHESSQCILVYKVDARLIGLVYIQLRLAGSGSQKPHPRSSVLFTTARGSPQVFDLLQVCVFNLEVDYFQML